MRTKSGMIVRALAGKGKIVFNDRTNAGRSIKVWGWKQADYDKAVRILEAADIPCKLVKTPDGGSPWRGGGCLRIHTQES